MFFPWCSLLQQKLQISCWSMVTHSFPVERSLIRWPSECSSFAYSLPFIAKWTIHHPFCSLLRRVQAAKAINKKGARIVALSGHLTQLWSGTAPLSVIQKSDEFNAQAARVDKEEGLNDITMIYRCWVTQDH